MNHRNYTKLIWKILGALVIIILIASPELLPMALFIDAIGVDLFIILLGMHSYFIIQKTISSLKFTLQSYIKYLLQVTQSVSSVPIHQVLPTIQTRSQCLTYRHYSMYLMHTVVIVFMGVTLAHNI